MPRLSTWFRGRTKLRTRWKAHLREHVIDLSWSPSNHLIAAAAIGGPIGVFDTQDGSVRHHLSGHGFGTTALAWLSDEILVSAGQDSTIRWWNVDTGTEVRSVDGGAAWVELLTASHHNKALVSATGRRLRLWSDEGALLRDYPEQPSTVSAVRWRPGHQEFTTAGYGGISLWTPDSDEPQRRFEWKGSILALAWSPDGRFIATGNQDSTVHFWYFESGEELQMWGYPTKVRELAWDRTSRFLATGGGPQVTVWDCSGKGPSGSKPLSLIGHDEAGAVTVLAYQSRGDTLASGGADGRVILWNPVEGTRAVTQFELTESISALAWSLEERYLAVAGGDGAISVLVG